MRLTTKGRFAVTAMIDLALRDHTGPVTLAGISQRQKISLSYLEQLFGKLRRHELVESLVHKQHTADLRKKLDSLHPADIAYILEALPLEERRFVWDLVKAERDGEILLEVSDAVRETLIAHMAPQELLAATEQLDTDEIADLAPDLPQAVVDELITQLDEEERQELQSALAYGEDQVGSVMVSQWR